MEKFENAREELGEHEKIVQDVVDVLREKGYFRAGEDAKITRPSPDQNWLLRCEVAVLASPPEDPERKKQFPSNDDYLYAALDAAGFRISVCPDFEGSDSTTDKVEYYLYKKE